MAAIVITEVAIAVYAIATAYLQGAKIANNGPDAPVKAEQVSPNYFFIWKIDKRAEQTTLEAACTYEMKTKTWLVELITGEKLALRDNGDEWEVAKKARK